MGETPSPESRGEGVSFWGGVTDSATCEQIPANVSGLTYG
jgi:hypothetical protein